MPALLLNNNKLLFNNGKILLKSDSYSYYAPSISLTSNQSGDKYCGNNITFTVNIDSIIHFTPIITWFKNNTIIAIGNNLYSITLFGLSNNDEIYCSFVYNNQILTSNIISIYNPGNFEVSITMISQNEFECSFKDIHSTYEWWYWKGDYPEYGKKHSIIAGGIGVWSCKKTLYVGESYINEPNYPGLWNDCLEVVVKNNKFCNGQASATYCINKFS